MGKHGQRGGQKHAREKGHVDINGARVEGGKSVVPLTVRPLDARLALEELARMSTASIRSTKTARRKPRARAKGRAVNKGPSFGEWARRVAGMIKGAPSELSSKPYEQNESTATVVQESTGTLTRYRTAAEAITGLRSDTKRRSKKSILSKMPRAKSSGKPVAFSHPAAFGEAARKYAGIVRSGVGDLSTREGFDD
jgi:hypothetical protein